MSSKKIFAVVNPIADFGHAWEGSEELRHIAREHGDIEWIKTEYPRQAVDLARESGHGGYDLIIALGGDGTTHEIVNGIMQLPPDQRPKLGIVPMGSGNDFSHAIGMAPHPADAMRQVLSGQSKKFDIGRLELEDGRVEYFTNAVGIGFDATVTNYFKDVKYLRGVPAYLIAIIKTILLHHEPRQMQVETDLESWEEESLMLVVCNGSREGGGFLVAPQSEPDDGILHYARVRNVSRMTMFRLIPEVMNGTHEKFEPVNLGKFHFMHLKSDKPLYIHTDGEIYAGFDSTITQLKIGILPGEIEIVI